MEKETELGAALHLVDALEEMKLLVFESTERPLVHVQFYFLSLISFCLNDVFPGSIVRFVDFLGEFALVAYCRYPFSETRCIWRVLVFLGYRYAFCISYALYTTLYYLSSSRFWCFL